MNYVDKSPIAEWYIFAPPRRYIIRPPLTLAEFEREMISERTKAGMASPRRRGKHIGRPRKLTEQQVEHARVLLESGDETRAAVAALFGVDVATLRRALRSERSESG